MSVPLPDPSAIDYVASAQQALDYPATPGDVLAQIAANYPQLRASVAGHPNAYPELLDWLDQQGDPAVSSAVAQRRGQTAHPSNAAHATPVGAPAGQPPTGPAPKRRLSGKVIGLTVAVAVVLLGLLAWLVVAPRLNSGVSPAKPAEPITTPAGPTSTSQAVPTTAPMGFAPIVAGGTGNDRFFSVQVVADGGYIAAGSTSSTDGDFPPKHGAQDALLARFGPDGTLQWAKTMGGAGDDAFRGVQVTPDGGFITVGDTTSTDGDFPPSHGGDVTGDALLARFGPDGTMQWAKTMGGADEDEFYSVAVAPDGGIIAAGYTTSTDGDFPSSHGNNMDAVLARFGADGTLQGVKTMGGSGGDVFGAVAVAPDGGVIAAGSTTSTDGDFPPSHGGDNFGDALLVKYGPDGTLQWAKTMGGTNDEEFNGVAITPDGGVIAAGGTISTAGDFPPIHDRWDALLARFGPDGTMQWAKTMGGSDDEEFLSVTVAPDGGAIAAGYTYSTDGDFPPSNGHQDAVLARFGPDGTLQWAKTTGGTEDDVFRAVAVAPDGGVAAAGSTVSTDGDFPPSHGGDFFGDALLAYFAADGTLRL